MAQLWQLKKLSTGEPLNEPQKLPENWGPIFGLSGVVDRLGNLSWLGQAYADMGWFPVGMVEDPVEASADSLAWERAKQLLRDSDWTMLPDVPMTAEDKIKWEEYRRGLREIRLQPGFPNDIKWPSSPY